jgi:hypothetical protein
LSSVICAPTLNATSSKLRNISCSSTSSAEFEPKSNCKRISRLSESSRLSENSDGGGSDGGGGCEVGGNSHLCRSCVNCIYTIMTFYFFISSQGQYMNVLQLF